MPTADAGDPVARSIELAVNDSKAVVTFQESNPERPVLLLHGGAGPASVLSFGTLLTQRQHRRVITPTHPGFNGTTRPDALQNMKDLGRLYVSLLDELNLHEVTLIGNSIGGWLAAEIALSASPRVRAAVLIDAVGADVIGHPVTDISGLTPPELRKLSFYDVSRLTQDPSAPAPAPELVAANMDALAVYGGTMQDATLLDRLGGLDLPVQLIWGAADGIVTPDYGRAYANAIPGARFAVIDDAGHLPQMETPEKVLAVIEEFVATP